MFYSVVSMHAVLAIVQTSLQSEFYTMPLNLYVYYHARFEVLTAI